MENSSFDFSQQHFSSQHLTSAFNLSGFISIHKDLLGSQDTNSSTQAEPNQIIQIQIHSFLILTSSQKILADKIYGQLNN